MADRSFHKQNTLPELTASEERTQIPSFVGPYKIESLLSRGGMSLLYLGLDIETRRPLAVKVLSPAYVTHPEAVAHFLKESKVIALTNHPNIVKLYGQGEWELGLYIAMELIHGISLKQFIIQHSLSIRRAIEIVLQVAYALLHLHSHGVIHRDIKPENILITEEGEVKVIDFGIAQLHEEKKVKSGLSRYLGTPNYISPEQKEDPSSVTFTTDIYSLGVILYELVLGKFSYGMINLSFLPGGLKKIAGKSLAISPGERYQTVSELIQDLSSYLNSKELDRERSGTDQMKEIHEQIQRTNLALSPFTLPSWPQMDLGLAKGRGTSQLGLYYDFFHLPNNTFLILFASTMTSSIESGTLIGVLRGMVRMHMREFTPTTKKIFNLTSLAQTLNEALCEDSLEQPFLFSSVLLDPLQDLVSYLSCGFSAMLHIPQGQSTPRSLASHNEPLGQHPSTQFAEAYDNWNAGDILLLHTFCFPAEEQQEAEEFKKILQDTTTEHLLFSAQRQSEGILKKISTLPITALIKHPKAFLSIQRII